MMKPNYPGRREFILGIAGSSVAMPAGAAECWLSFGPPAGVHNDSKLKRGDLVANVLDFGAVGDGTFSILSCFASGRRSQEPMCLSLCWRRCATQWSSPV